VTIAPVDDVAGQRLVAMRLLLSILHARALGVALRAMGRDKSRVGDRAQEARGPEEAGKDPRGEPATAREQLCIQEGRCSRGRERWVT
jgi:hypothetical protein